MSLCTYSIPVLTALLHVYNHVLTFTKLATDNASGVKSKSGNFLAYMNLFIPSLGTILHLAEYAVCAALDLGSEPAIS